MLISVPAEDSLLQKDVTQSQADARRSQGRAGVVAQPEDTSGSPELPAGLATHTGTAVQPSPVSHLPPDWTIPSFLTTFQAPQPWNSWESEFTPTWTAGTMVTAPPLWKTPPNCDEITNITDKPHEG